jgi:flagellin
MGLRINTNIEAFNAHRSLASTSSRLSKSMEKLASGFRINSAADDAAGLGISERMRAQISGVAQAARNAQDGISLVQTAEGSLQEFHSILHRIRDLAVQYNNTADAQSRFAITGEVAQLSAEVTRMLTASSFNGITLLAGSIGGVMATLQIGANNGEIITIQAAAVGAELAANTVVNDFANAINTTTYISLASLDQVIDTISRVRSNLGGIQNRLEHTVNSLGVYQENLQAAESRIRDVDMAEEMTNFTKLQILQQSGTAMLAQANLAPQSILQLLS